MLIDAKGLTVTSNFCSFVLTFIWCLMTMFLQVFRWRCYYVGYKHWRQEVYLNFMS